MIYIDGDTLSSLLMGRAEVEVESLSTYFCIPNTPLIVSKDHYRFQC